MQMTQMISGEIKLVLYFDLLVNLHTVAEMSHKKRIDDCKAGKKLEKRLCGGFCVPVFR